jgi:type I restriction enzyme M protein
MTHTKTLSKQLRAVRDHLGISQEELAFQLGVSFATVNRWEGGKAKPQRAQLEKFEELLSQVDFNDGILSEAPNVELNRLEPTPKRRRGVKSSTAVGGRAMGTKSMEQMLWDAACSIRGEKDAPKFKDYLLPLLFIKRLSDVFDDEVQRLVETYGDKETALQILEADHSLVRFYIPPEARWAVVSGRETFDWAPEKKPKSLGEQLTTTIREIVKANPSLDGTINIVNYNETRNGEREISDAALKGVIETYSHPRYRLGLHDVEPDFLGRCYEYLLRKFAEGQGQSAGEFFTPTEVGFLMAELIRPRPGEECYDYACGSFGLLIKLQLVCKRLDPLSKVPLKLYGQELTGSSYAIACMNKIIHDMEGEVLRGDSMRNPKFRESDTSLKKFDIIVANPMWNQDTFTDSDFENDRFERFDAQGGKTISSNADWAWLQHTLSSMKDTGRAAVILDAGAVSRGSEQKAQSKEKIIRQWFVDNDYIEGVILLPENLFYNTSASGIVVILNKRKARHRKHSLVLINASQEFKKGQPKNYLPTEAISRISKAFFSPEQDPTIARVLSTEQVLAADYNLSPLVFVRTSQRAQTRPLEELVSRLAQIESRSAEHFSRLLPLVSVIANTESRQ